MFFASVDQTLARSKFDGLEAVRIEILVETTRERSRQWCRRKVEELFPTTLNKISLQLTSTVGIHNISTFLKRRSNHSQPSAEHVLAWTQTGGP